jgi:hypothetical protein
MDRPTPTPRAPEVASDELRAGLNTELHAPESPPEHLPVDDLSFLNVDSLDRLRHEQQIFLTERQLSIEDINDETALRNATEEAYTQFGALIGKYLDEHGVGEGHPNRLRYKAFLKEYSIDRINPIEYSFKNVASEEGKYITPREQAQGAYLVLEQEARKNNTDKDREKLRAAPDSDEETLRKQAEKEKLENERKSKLRDLDVARQELAALTAKRQARLFTRYGAEDAYRKVRNRHNDVLLDVGKLEDELRQLEAPDRTEETKRLGVALWLLEQEKELRTKVVEKFEDTKLRGFIRWMNAGGLGRRIAKGVAVGAVGASFGLVGAALVSTGVGTLLAGAAAGAGTKLLFNMLKGYAVAEGGKSALEINQVDTRTAEVLVNELDPSKTLTDKDALIEAIIRRHNEDLEVDTYVEQSKRRRSLGKAAIIAVLSGAAGVGAGMAWHAMFDGADAGVSGHATLAPPPATPSPSPPSVHDSLPAPHHAAETLEFNPDAYHIEPGEGWYQEFENMGIPKEQWPSLLEKVGPQLQDVHIDSGVPLAYFDSAHNQWFMHMTPDGKMPQQAVDVIAKGAGLQPPTPAHAAASAALGHPGGGHAADLQPHGSADIDHGQNISSGHSTMEHVSGGATDSFQPTDIDHSSVLANASQIHSGEGGVEFVRKLGLRPRDWYSLQERTDLLRGPFKGYFMELSDGNIGFAKPGKLPPGVMAALLKKLPLSRNDFDLTG